MMGGNSTPKWRLMKQDKPNEGKGLIVDKTN